MIWKTNAAYKGYLAVILVVLLVTSTVTCIKFADRTLDEQSIQGDITPEYPQPWELMGKRDGQPAFDYYGGTDIEIKRGGVNSVTFLAIATMRHNQARLYQRFSANLYKGKRVRFSGYMKTNMVNEWAGLWMRVDTRDKQAWSFDDMEDRALKGVNDWTYCEIVLDVPEDAEVIYIGAHLYGEGQVWVDDFGFEIVGKEVEATDPYSFHGGYNRRYLLPGLLEEEPVNLNFEEEFVGDYD